MKNVRAKMQVMSVKELIPRDKDADRVQEIELSAICHNFDENGDSEDNTYARYTPTARLSMTVTNPALMDHFRSGDKYYIDFTKVEEE